LDYYLRKVSLAMTHALTLRRLLVLVFTTSIAFAMVGARPALSQTPEPVPFSVTLKMATAKTEAKDWKEAATLWEQVTTANPVVGDFWYQLADARYNAKDYRRAIAAYEKALELGLARFRLYAPPYQIACCYALLGDKVQSLAWLEKALAAGYPDLPHARTDTDLQILQGDPRFVKLVAAADVTKMTRDEGWRYDIALLSREIKRMAINPFEFTPEREFDAFVSALLDRVPQLSDVQIDIELRKLFHMVGRSHSIVINGRPNPGAFHPLPFQTYFFNEGLFIVAADSAHKDLVGAQILRFGNSTAAEVLRTMSTIISARNEYRPLRIVPELLRSTTFPHALGLIPDEDKVVLSLRLLDGTTRTVTVATDQTLKGYGDVPPPDWTFLENIVPGPIPLYLKNRRANFWYEYLPESKTMYVSIYQLRNIPDDPHKAFYEKLFKEIDAQDVARLVIDFRWNGGGNTANGRALVNEVLKRDKLNQKGKLFVIVGRFTLSASINVADWFEQETNAILVGEPSSDSPNFVGESNLVTLPWSKSRFLVSNLYWQYAGPIDTRQWLTPTLYAPPTFAAAKMNRDPAMEAILAYR
jgi:hypothetical protein